MKDYRVILRIVLIVVGACLGFAVLYYIWSVISEYLMTLAAVTILLLAWTLVRVSLVSMEAKTRRA